MVKYLFRYNYMKYFLQGLEILGWMGLFFVGSFLFHFGASLANNKTKKICDLCFRDIKRWHNEVENYKKENDIK